MTRDLSPDVHNCELLLFDVGDGRYALPVERVREVLPQAATSPLRTAPKGLVGMLRLRGELLPIVDLRQRLGLPAIAPQIGQCIIATRVGSAFVGLLVDGVRQIVSGGEMGSSTVGSGTGFVQCVTQVSGSVVSVIDAEAAVGKTIGRFLTTVLEQRELPELASKPADSQEGTTSLVAHTV